MSALDLTGVPQSGQNECLRFAPLSEVLTYTFGCPVSRRNVDAGACAETRKPVPVSIWQSVQLQTWTLSGSISASYVIWPQWQDPWTFIANKG